MQPHPYSLSHPPSQAFESLHMKPKEIHKINLGLETKGVTLLQPQLSPSYDIWSYNWIADYKNGTFVS